MLQAQDRVRNAENNYRNQVLARRRQQALAEENRIRQEDVDQARQQELSSRNGWISARQRYENELDSFKILLGLPTDAKLVAERDELQRLSALAKERFSASPEEEEQNGQPVPASDAPVNLVPPSRNGGGPFEIPEDKAILVALENRLDLKSAKEQVIDAQRQIAVAANALKAGLDLTGSASFGERRSLGSANLPDARLDPTMGFYTAGLKLDLPFERTAERNVYRNSYIGFEQSTRRLQSLEDQIKQDIRLDLRNLLEQRESYRIQLLAQQVAARRVDRTQVFLELGRAGVSARDVNEAQAALLQAQNSVTSALISYRLSELALQRDMGVLQVNQNGLYKEIDPDELD